MTASSDHLQDSYMNTTHNLSRDESPPQPEVLDKRLSSEFKQRLARYMGDYDPSSVFAKRYFDWYRDHAGGRSDWFRADLLWRLECAEPLDGKRVLDFGCGTGSSAVVFAERGAQVVGAETEQISLAIAIQRASDLDVQDRCAFVRIPYIDTHGGSLPFRQESFDLCTLIGVLEHMKPIERTVCVAEIRRVLKPGGRVFIFDTPNRAHPKDYHTTNLWFVGWVPQFLASQYATLRGRFERGQDFQRRGATGISRWEIDRLFPPNAWQTTYEKNREEVAKEFGWLARTSTIMPGHVRERMERWLPVLAGFVLSVCQWIGSRPTFWTASHTICLTKMPRP